MCMYLTVNAVSIAELWPRRLTDTCICETAIKGLHSLLGGDKLLVDTIYDVITLLSYGNLTRVVQLADDILCCMSRP